MLLTHSSLGQVRAEAYVVGYQSFKLKRNSYTRPTRLSLKSAKYTYVHRLNIGKNKNKERKEARKNVTKA